MIRSSQTRLATAAAIIIVAGVAVLPNNSLGAPKSKGNNKKVVSAQRPKNDSKKSPPSQVAKKSPANSLTSKGDFSKAPTYIKADTLTLNSEQRTFVYSGNVEVVQGDMTLTSTTLDGTYTETNQIKTLIARKNVTVTKGEDIRATGERADYDAAQALLLLTENPELQNQGSVLSADVIKIFLNENRSAAEGQVRVKVLSKDDKALNIVTR